LIAVKVDVSVREEKLWIRDRERETGRTGVKWAGLGKEFLRLRCG
jgi:hypothetical protein